MPYASEQALQSLHTTKQYPVASISLPLDTRGANLLLNKTPVLLHGIDIYSKSHLVLNEKDSPPYHPGKTKFSQHVFQANENFHLCCFCSTFKQRHQNQRNKEREKKNLLARISVQN